MQHILNCHEILKTDIIRADNCYLYDSKGERYIDLESGVWCIVLGHGHPKVNRAIHRQLGKVIHLNYRVTSTTAEAAAASLLATADIPDGKCTFLGSGSEAVEFSIKLARTINPKPQMLTLSDLYLGAYGLAGNLDRKHWVTLDWQSCRSCLKADQCDDGCELFREIPFEKISGFVFEPGSTGGTVIFPPKAMIRRLTEAVRMHRGLLIVDEVTTGIGRTGQWFGYQHYDLEPDIISTGKGLGNGYPVSAVMVTQKTAAQVEKKGLRFAQSHMNDPLGCIIVHAVLQAMKDAQLVERSRHIGGLFLELLGRLRDQYPFVKRVTGRGLMLAMAFDSGRMPAVSAGEIFRELLKSGFLAGYKPLGNVLTFHPPLTIDEEDIRDLIACLDRILGRRRRQ